MDDDGGMLQLRLVTAIRRKHDVLNSEEEKMERRAQPNDVTPRRSFFKRIAASAMAIGFAGLGPVAARAAAGAEDGPDWPGELKGRHRQVVDAYAPNDGFPLAFAFTFVVTNGPASAGVVPASAVVVLRHTAFPLALDHTMWQKYKIGQSLSILDPETKAPAVKNPFLQPKPGVLTVDDMAIDRVLANGAVIGACGIALKVLSGKLAQNAGMSAEEAAKEWAANIIPGITVIPSGTWGVNRAQEHGCTYCAGG
jgi:hypothetical protein